MRYSLKRITKIVILFLKDLVFDLYHKITIVHQLISRFYELFYWGKRLVSKLRYLKTFRMNYYRYLLKFLFGFGEITFPIGNDDVILFLSLVSV